MSRRRTMAVLSAVPMFLFSASAIAQEPAAAAPQPSPNDVLVHKLFEMSTTNSGDRITMPHGNLQVTVSKYVIPAGASLPLHKHLFPRYAYVIQGMLEVINVGTGNARQFSTGQFVAEDVQKWHKARNIGDVPVELLVIDFVKPGRSNTVLQKGP